MGDYGFEGAGDFGGSDEDSHYMSGASNSQIKQILRDSGPQKIHMPNLIRDHVFVSKSWGHEEWICNNSLYCGKILFVKRDKHTSWHYHKIKTEDMYVISGCAIIGFLPPIQDGKEILQLDRIIVLNEGDSLHIDPYIPHCIFGSEDSKVIETSTQHFDTDSYRLLSEELQAATDSIKERSRIRHGNY